MADSSDRSRRAFIQTVIGVSGDLVLLGAAAPVWVCAGEAPAKQAGEAEAQEEEVSPAEDLMREHGVLKRVLLISEEAIHRLDHQKALPPDAVADAASIIRSFIEDYHEKLEEEFLFPRFRQANTLVDLVEVLQAQHQAGRSLTETTRRLATSQAFKHTKGRQTLTTALRAFIRMYNPHEAREDTVLFPAFRRIVPSHEYEALGETFEAREHALFGEDGFEKMVDRVATIEKRLGLYNLAQVTPRH
jgi:hemerythrin-like domain-containing protein